MNTRIVDYFYFFLTLFSINIFIFIIYSQIYYSTYVNKNPLSSNYSILLLADSHGLCLSDNFKKDIVFNFSAESDSYSEMRRKLNYCISKNKNIKTLILTADDHTLSSYREKMNNMDRLVPFQHFYVEYKLYGLKGLKTYFQNFIQYYFVLLNPKAAGFTKRFISGKIQGLFRNKLSENSNFNWEFQETRMQLAQSRFESQFPDFERSSKLSSDLIGIFQDCKENNIDVIGLKFPITPIYQKIKKGRSYGASDFFALHNLKIIDLENSIADTLGNFQNQDHLTLKGGKLLALKLVEIL